MAGVASFFACFCWLLLCFALLFLSLCCFDNMICLVELILKLNSSLRALVCLALPFFALLSLAWPCFALVCLALPCLALLHLAWPYFTHALSVPLLLRFAWILPYVGSFFALVAHFFDFFTHLKSSCIFDTFFGGFGVIF